MAKVMVRDPNSVRSDEPRALVGGAAVCSAYFDGERDRLHLHRIDVKPEDGVKLSARNVDIVSYVWMGGIEARHVELPAGSSLVVERGGTVDLRATGQGATILIFAAGRSDGADRPAAVHLLPAADAPRSDRLGGAAGVVGVMHADSDCPTCRVWLHENIFPAGHGTGGDEEAGVHSHSEDEIIFVTAGEMSLGHKLYGPGTALAIAADTLYSFSPGPSGLSFVNFRASRPGQIKFADGSTIDEPQYWRDRLPRPVYRSGWE